MEKGCKRARSVAGLGVTGERVFSVPEVADAITRR